MVRARTPVHQGRTRSEPGKHHEPEMEGPGRTRGVAAGAGLDQVRQGGTRTRAGSNERARRAGDRRRSNRTKILFADERRLLQHQNQNW